MTSSIPQPGDLILVEKSEWYALKDGQRLRVCETIGWSTAGESIYVAPRHQVGTFWGPGIGPPDGVKPEVMSTSGGPFKTIPLTDAEGLEPIGRELDWFWCWQDSPRAHGGVNYQKEVTLWRLPLLIDHHHRHVEKYRKGVDS